ncbi:MAG: tRNA (adenosine(37)-N6)-threonylcarbamoyltransferase complex ATPase subunit type 1 TsaE [Bacillota bacterium]
MQDKNVTMLIESKSIEDTFLAGQELSKELIIGDVVTLNGDLGSGKTVFAKGIASGLGVNDLVTSPTFTIINEYQGRIPLFHFDVYRIQNPAETEEIGLVDYLYGDGVCVIEWSDLIKEQIPNQAIDIRIYITDDNSRKIEIRR